MNPQDRALCGVRPSEAFGNKSKDAVAMNEFAMLFNGEIKQMIHHFLEKDVPTFASFKEAWEHQSMSTLYHIDFGIVSRPEIVHIMYQEALGSLVETISMHQTEQRRTSFALDVLRRKSLAQVFTLYCLYTCQPTPIKQKILLDIESAKSIQRVLKWNEDWGDTFKQATREAHAMIIQLKRSFAFIKCIRGYNWNQRALNRAAHAASTAENISNMAPYEPLKLDLTLRHLHEAYNSSMKSFRTNTDKPAHKGKRNAPSIRLPNMPSAKLQMDAANFMEKFCEILGHNQDGM
ncbi:hypothetical protein THRCLA_02801 [Thraustotheca clavata]|uniref:Uncharacterized protein n=1 Tax=Thraustotheca clavata TaxID=74557 RepID=A0A1W0A499_9STRA|nr:hypothetical protein THRCLA_02801 [Thraustotheca clavata]